MRTPTRALLIPAVTVCLLTGCAATTTAGPAASANPTVGITTHSVVTSGSGVPSIPPVPNLVGQTDDLADATAQALGFYTTPEAPGGDTLNLTSPGDWTVCSQSPAAGPSHGSNGIILTVVNTAAGKTCPGAAPSTPAAGGGTLLQVSGNGIKNTKQFTTGDNWTINYTYDCTGFLGGTGNFTVYVDYPNGDVAVNELGSKGSSSSTETGAGMHSLKVSSECNWTVKVTDG
ncbi:hypothetical protein ABH931_006137 [Streptacidiphilus sp. MAP12-33]|uniref:hypothetical protein n=1 Tax=Streptacidiphilus sp. MAP12-33 TaxID=3156266 RepID=UPI003517C1D7